MPFFNWQFERQDYTGENTDRSFSIPLWHVSSIVHSRFLFPSTSFLRYLPILASIFHLTFNPPPNPYPPRYHHQRIFS